MREKEERRADKGEGGMLTRLRRKRVIREGERGWQGESEDKAT